MEGATESSPLVPDDDHGHNTSAHQTTAYNRGSVEYDNEGTMLARDSMFPEWISVPERYTVDTRGSYLAFFKAYVGSGILFLPRGFMSGGLMLSTVAMLGVTALAVTATLHVVEAKRRLASDFISGNFHGVLKPQKEISFGMLARVALGGKGRWVVDGSIVLSQLGFAGSSLIFATKNIQSLVQRWTDCATTPSIGHLLLFLVPCLVPVALFRRLARFNKLIVLADILVVLGIVYVFGRNIARIAERGVDETVVQAEGLSFFVFFGNAVYSLEGTAFLLPIELAIRDKEQFASVAKISTISVGVLYTLFGALGYMAFGNLTEMVVLLNLHNAYPGDPTVDAVQVMYVVAVMVSYPFNLYPAAIISEAYIFKKRKSPAITWSKNGWRLCLVMITALACIYGGDSYDNFIGLVGGLACVPLTLVYPAVFHLFICKDTLTDRQKTLDYALIGIGCVGTLCATAVSLHGFAAAGPPPPLVCTP